MAARSPLVAGGTPKGFSTHPGTFLTHTVPVIHKNTIVVAATHPSVQTGEQTKDGWFLSDFYAFNYLLKGAVAEENQIWLTAADPEKLVSKWGDYLHGYPLRDRKVVLSHDLLKSEITPVTVVPSTNMIDRFLEEAKKASTRARDDNCPLLLMIFCHGIENYHLLLDNGNHKKGLSIVRLKEALGSDIAVTLFTTAYYSGGWAVTPDLNLTAMTAADEDEKSLSWHVSESVGRACGSVFAGATISALSEASTPLLPQDSSSSKPLEDDEETCLQPKEPTEIQTETYNKFCHTITDTLDVQGISRVLGDSFRFSAQNDQWESSWTEIPRIPLAHFSQRWENLATYPAPPSEGTSDEGPSHFTGTTDACIDETTRLMAQRRVHSMTELFYNELCPGDWQGGMTTRLSSQIWRFLNNIPEAPTVDTTEEIANAIYFRWDTCQLIDRFVNDHHLQRPNDEICVIYNRQTYHHEKRQLPDFRAWEDRKSQVWNALMKGGAEISPADHQGPPFPRPHQYICDAITESYATWKEAEKVVDEYCEYVARSRKFHLDQVVTSPAVRSSGRQWLKTIGRRIRRSLSPSRSLRSSLSHSIERLEISEAADTPTSKKLGKAPVIFRPLARQQYDEETREGSVFVKEEV